MTATRTCRGSNHSRRQAAQALARLRPAARRPGGNSQAVHAHNLRRDLCLKPGQRHAAATMTEYRWGRRGRIATARSGTGSTSGQARSKPGPSACTSRPTNVANHPSAARPIPNPDTPNLANPKLVGDRKRRHTRTWARNTSVRAKGNTHSHRQASRSHILDSTKQTQDPKSRR